jgi:hypothetical protein
LRDCPVQLDFGLISSGSRKGLKLTNANRPTPLAMFFGGSSFIPHPSSFMLHRVAAAGARETWFPRQPNSPHGNFKVQRGSG